MQILLPAADFEFLKRVRDLGITGKTQAEIAAEMSMSLTTLRYRLEGLGFKFQTTNDVWTTLSKRPLNELIESGEIAPAHSELVAA